ncbi:MAG TPA: hypothetical protein VK738_12810 [Terriglobales bacterium]|nr:hypothetical protein [Terriglobales bacterium]
MGGTAVHMGTPPLSWPHTKTGGHGNLGLAGTRALLTAPPSRFNPVKTGRAWPRERRARDVEGS